LNLTLSTYAALTTIKQRGAERGVSMSANIEHNQNAIIVRLSGELDHHNADRVRSLIEQAMMKEQVKHVVMDLQKLTFMDSSGIGVILGRYKQVKARGGKMIICHANRTVNRLLELSGLFKIIESHDDENRALSSLEVVS
jgi:stage II sporulation protein AA (anti-sigma F factor antagonist)